MAGFQRDDVLGVGKHETLADAAAQRSLGPRHSDRISDAKRAHERLASRR
ncbi:MAG: hypothetical protein ACR2GT_13220 [Gaiellaceae bacterium]